MVLLIVISAIALQVLLTVKKVHPFLSLLFVSLLAGLFLGLSAEQLLSAIKKGVADTAGSILLVIGLGAMLGKILEESRAAEKISLVLINALGQKNIQWAVMITGFLIGIPLFFNAGFMILVPLVFSLAKRASLPLLYIAIPMVASLSATHCFLPPHPGPVFLVNAFGADVGKTLLYGLVIAVPAVIIAGPLLGRVMQRMKTTAQGMKPGETKETVALPAAFPSFFFALLPVLLITLNVVAGSFPGNTIVSDVLLFTGDSTVALLLSVMAALIYFTIFSGKTMDSGTAWLGSSMAGIAGILFIILAGGIFKQVLTDSGTADYIASFSSKWRMPPLLFAWVITAILRVTIGSATVAGITAAGVIAPLALTGTVSPELLVLAVGTGSVFGSHVNDSAFWMFKEFFGVSLKQTFLSWTIMESTISVIGLTGVLLLSILS